MPFDSREERTKTSEKIYILTLFVMYIFIKIVMNRSGKDLVKDS